MVFDHSFEYSLAPLANIEFKQTTQSPHSGQDINLLSPMADTILNRGKGRSNAILDFMASVRIKLLQPRITGLGVSKTKKNSDQCQYFLSLPCTNYGYYLKTRASEVSPAIPMPM
jgi:hypothetical protein